MFRRHALDVDDRVAQEHGGQAVGKVARKAGIPALMQLEKKIQLPFRSGHERHAYIIGPFVGVAEQRLKKSVGTFGREYLVQAFSGEDFFVTGHQPLL